ncbi:unnamed protein product [Adineta ricciae]|uniref:CCZ1/INTU/HSP4 first Longin domain-containing protein n=1 Tax=Adineta ricciae TaxID=249248 RepID=A0A813S508_ADIRI|nr:unnamed protein product [Adineta ricciae]
MVSTDEHPSSKISLVDYFIYCPLFCRKEGQEEQKILYYHPSTRELDRKIRTIGYCEGLVKFTETFTCEQSCESIHFQKSRLLFYLVENDIGFAMTLHVPVVEQKKDDKCFLEYLDERINDRVMLPILKMSYRYFALQYGTISALIQRTSVENARNVLKEYFDKFIECHLHRMIHHATFDSSFFGIHFISLDKQIYLKFQAVLRRWELQFASLNETVFIYRNQLVWSGLNQDDTTLIYSFFRLYYWPHLKIMPHTSTIQYLSVDSCANQFNSSTNVTSQKFYLGSFSFSYSVLVLHYDSFTSFCIFHNDNDLLDNEKTSTATHLFRQDLEIILPSFYGYLQRKHPIPDVAVKNAYYNKVNMAHSATINWHKDLSNPMSSVMNTLAEDLQWFHPSGEIMVKRENDPWIIAKRSDRRELLVMINQKGANLKQIRGNVKAFFNGIFFFDASIVDLDKIKQILSTQFNSILLFE